MTILEISPQDFAALYTTGKAKNLIDVRTPVEFREVHIEGAQNWPLDQLNPTTVMASRSAPLVEPLYVICRSGSRGRQACNKFVDAGYNNVMNVAGGTLACIDCGVSVVRGKSVISLERQVRIAAGSLVLLGVGLGWFVHPALAGIAAFVGAGLTFSGITNTCGMGLLLARMPWNQVHADNATCCSPSVGNTSP